MRIRSPLSNLLKNYKNMRLSVLPFIKDVSPADVMNHSEEAVVEWVMPNSTLMSDLTKYLTEIFDCKIFTPGTLIAWRHSNKDPIQYGIVFKKITDNGWYIILNESGRYELVGDTMMEIVNAA